MGLIASIFRDRNSDCSNGGISSRHDRVTIVNVEGPFDPTPNAPAVKLVVRGIGGERVVHFEPVEPVAEGNVGYMAGGAFVASSDSRFRRAVGFYGAVSLHDRQESAELNALLSI